MSFPEKIACRPPAAYTNAPARILLRETGQIDLDRPQSVFVHWATRQQQFPESEGPLALRWVQGGQRFFESGRERYAIDDTSYILFNRGRVLSSQIQSDTPVACYAVCFQPSLVEEALRSLITPADRLLDDPRGEPGQPVLFHERTYRHDALVSPKLFHLQRCCDCPGATYGWFEEQFHDLLARLLQAHRNIFQEIERVPAARAATRAELYTRLHRARDFMEANLRGSLTLAEIAETAYLSPHHFLRLFKQVFSETPHQYIIHRRIERARHLLLHTDTPVTDICFQIGFESLGSFSWLFHRRVGVSPETYRLQNRGPVFAIRNGKKAARSDKGRAKDLCAQPLS